MSQPSVRGSLRVTHAHKHQNCVYTFTVHGIRLHGYGSRRDFGNSLVSIRVAEGYFRDPI